MDQITRSVTNIVAPIKTVRIENNTREWFNGEIAEKIHKQDKLYKKFKLSKLADEDLYREAQTAVQNFIQKKEKSIL